MKTLTIILMLCIFLIGVGLGIAGTINLISISNSDIGVSQTKSDNDLFLSCYGTLDYKPILNADNGIMYVQVGQIKSVPIPYNKYAENITSELNLKIQWQINRFMMLCKQSQLEQLNKDRQVQVPETLTIKER